MGIIRRYGDTDFITGLRAIASMMVIAVHTGAFNDLGSIGTQMSSAGKFGVQVFLVISGFTIASTFLARQDYVEFIIRRLFRILPLYFFMLSLSIAMIAFGLVATPYWMERFGSQPNSYNYIMHLTLLSPFDYTVANSLLNVEWSIPVEVWWYVALPFLITRASNPRTIAITLAGLLALSGFTRGIFGVLDLSHAAKWFPTTYGAYFLLGLVSYHLRKIIDQTSAQKRLKLYTIGWLLFASAIIFDTGIQSVLIGVGTMLIIGYRSGTAVSRSPLESSLFLFLGSISFSVYLWHMVVIWSLEKFQIYEILDYSFLRFLVVTAITVALSTLTYRLVEAPSNSLGRVIASRSRLRLQSNVFASTNDDCRAN
ncbi:acyltransferase family protein [Rhodopirellula bahusiensis]|uniref:acyltransferase family protein n=1 Tax=Rhodopirellula bahusiensis TaxID=2014065 RepID=UPI00326720DE